MTSAARVLAHAVGRRLVTSDDALSGRVTVRVIGASNFVHRLDLDGVAVAYVKSTGQAAAMDGDDSVAREMEVLERLRGGTYVPEVLSATTPDQLWLAPAAGMNLAELVGAGDVAAMSEAFAAAGRALAGLHTAPVREGAPLLRLPWPMLENLPAHMETARHHEVPTHVITTARSLRVVTAAAREHWQPSAWVHGDVSPMNVIIAPDGLARLIDWEGAGVGDPAWDLAGADLMALLVAPQWHQIATARLRHSYREASGTAHEPDPALKCVRTLVAAYQQAVGALAMGAVPDSDGTVTRLLDEAHALAARHTAETRSVSL